MFIEIRIQNVYGNDLIYPVCDTAKRHSGCSNKFLKARLT